MNRPFSVATRVEVLEEFIRLKRNRIARGVLASDAARIFELIEEVERELRRLQLGIDTPGGEAARLAERARRPPRAMRD